MGMKDTKLKRNLRLFPLKTNLTLNERINECIYSSLLHSIF